MNANEMTIASKQLSQIYILSDRNPSDIDPTEKDRLYSLAKEYPEIHHRARKLANEYWKKRQSR